MGGKTDGWKEGGDFRLQIADSRLQILLRYGSSEFAIHLCAGGVGQSEICNLQSAI